MEAHSWREMPQSSVTTLSPGSRDPGLRTGAWGPSAAPKAAMHMTDTINALAPNAHFASTHTNTVDPSYPPPSPEVWMPAFPHTPISYTDTWAEPPLTNLLLFSGSGRKAKTLNTPNKQKALRPYIWNQWTNYLLSPYYVLQSSPETLIKHQAKVNSWPKSAAQTTQATKAEANQQLTPRAALQESFLQRQNSYFVATGHKRL